MLDPSTHVQLLDRSWLDDVGARVAPTATFVPSTPHPAVMTNAASSRVETEASDDGGDVSAHAACAPAADDVIALRPRY